MSFDAIGIKDHLLRGRIREAIGHYAESCHTDNKGPRCNYTSPVWYWQDLYDCPHYLPCQVVDTSIREVQALLLSPTRELASQTEKDESDEMLSRGFKDQVFDVYRYLPPNLQVQCMSLLILQVACVALLLFQEGVLASRMDLTMRKMSGYLMIKCGSLEDARKVFNKMEIKNLAKWNSMITGLGVHGHGEEALALFAQMEKANVQPNAITFIELYNRANMNDEVCEEELNTTPDDLNKRTAVELRRLNTKPEELNKNIEFLRQNALVEKMHLNTAALASIEDNVANADKISSPFAKESQCLGVSTSYVYLKICLGASSGM